MDKAITILYVDDEPINLMLFEQLFVKSFSVLTAESGFIGLDILQEKPEINVIVSDMKMPGMTGLEFIKQAKLLYPNILFYILTGFEITSEIVESLESGLIVNYFQKPFDLKEICRSIQEKMNS